MVLEEMTRSEMEFEILVENILPCNTADELAAIAALTDDEMRERIRSWIEAGSEV